MANPTGPITEEMKVFIVTCWAMFMRNIQVIDAVKERFGVILDRRAIDYYKVDNQKAARKLSKRWIALHNDIRARFEDELFAIPIANRAVRLRQLQAHYDQAADRGNAALACQILEQAAKEIGGAMTNERKVQHSGTVKVDRELTEDELRAKIADALAEAWEKRPPGQPGTTTLQ